MKRNCFLIAFLAFSVAKGKAEVMLVYSLSAIMTIKAEPA